MRVMVEEVCECGWHIQTVIAVMISKTESHGRVYTVCEHCGINEYASSRSDIIRVVKMLFRSYKEGKDV